MFTNLIESDADRSAFKRRSSFFAATVAAYTLFLFAAAIAGVLTYDARVDAQTTSLELLEWIPPVKPVVKDTPPETRSTRKPAASNAQTDPNLKVPMRTNPTLSVTDPTKAPETIGTTASTEPPVTGAFVIGPKNADPPGSPPGTEGSLPPTDTTPPIKKEDPPVVEPVKPTTHNVSTGVLVSKVISLPKPAYPIIAKQIKAQGPVNVQILVNEDGRVISAHALKGHPTLLRAAEEAALRARFTPTMLSNQPVKVQGVIVYNFVLQ
jgi:protein TonB